MISNTTVYNDGLREGRPKTDNCRLNQGHQGPEREGGMMRTVTTLEPVDTCTSVICRTGEPRKWRNGVYKKGGEMKSMGRGPEYNLKH